MERCVKYVKAKIGKNVCFYVIDVMTLIIFIVFNPHCEIYPRTIGFAINARIKLKNKLSRIVGVILDRSINAGLIRYTLF
jgi:hypothetical protein